ncbi:adenylyltransferase/cytidyltransferase family protein [Candidatus Parcubacteria bacterium]|nr:adenylyltransferase/cytidyltransferase family protein [Candidatus Parcubacteria bacterium]
MKVLSFVDPYKANLEQRIVPDIEELKKRVEAIRIASSGNCTIVLTQGTFDIKHVGHDRYLENARSQGDFLVVGIDSDSKVRKRKGKHRPVVNQDERMESVCHTRYADLVILKDESWEKWGLTKSIQPDVLIATQETYSEEEIKELENGYCKKVVVLPPQAETTTSAKVRKLLIDGLDNLSNLMSKKFPNLLKECVEEVLSSHKKPEKEDKK